MRKDLEEIVFRKKLQQVAKPKNDVEAVIAHLLDENQKLTAAQDLLCTRLLFGVSNYRAEQDIYDAQRVFTKTRKISKAYVLHYHIQSIELQIKKCEDAKQFKLLPKLYDALTYALNSLPEDNDKGQPPPATLVFQFNGQLPVEQKPLSEVLKDTDELLKAPIHGDYLEFEEDHSAESATDDGADGSVE
jgi:hypothetical protein